MKTKYTDIQILNAFNDKWEISQDSSYNGTPCWLWTGSLNNRMYGQFSFRGKTTTAHRVAYILFVGEIPDGLCVDHLCRVTKCVNPGHLEPVTQRENVSRGNAGLHERIKTHCPKGHIYAGDNLRIHNNSRKCKQCQKENSRKYSLRQKEIAK